jgi:hypothetical protein
VGNIEFLENFVIENSNIFFKNQVLEGKIG